MMEGASSWRTAAFENGKEDTELDDKHDTSERETERQSDKRQ